MIAPSVPTCTACSLPAKRELLRKGAPFCSGCWASVPAAKRRALEKAGNDLARWPMTSHVQAAHDVALRAAVSAARGGR